MQEKASVKNQSVEKIFSIIEVMAAEPLPMRLQDIASAVNIPASTALRFVNTLLSMGYVMQDPRTLRYSPTLKFTNLGAQIASHMSVRDVTRPYLEDLANFSGESCSLIAPQSKSCVTLDVVSGQSDLLQVVRRPGAQAPMHVAGGGKLFLMDCSSAELEAYVRVSGLSTPTANAVSTLQQLSELLQTVRAQGYAMDDEESELGVRSIAVPIKDYTGKTAFAISIAAPSPRFTDERISQLLPRLKQTGQEISVLMGYQGKDTVVYTR